MIVTCHSRIELQPTPPAGVGQLRWDAAICDEPDATAEYAARTVSPPVCAGVCDTGASDVPDTSKGVQPLAWLAGAVTVTVPPLLTQSVRELSANDTTRVAGHVDEPEPPFGGCVVGCCAGGGDVEFGGVDVTIGGAVPSAAVLFEVVAHAPRSVEANTVAASPTSAIAVARARDVAWGRGMPGQAVISMRRAAGPAGSRRSPDQHPIICGPVVGPPSVRYGVA